MLYLHPLNGFTPTQWVFIFLFYFLITLESVKSKNLHFRLMTCKHCLIWGRRREVVYVMLWCMIWIFEIICLKLIFFIQFNFKNKQKTEDSNKIFQSVQGLVSETKKPAKKQPVSKVTLRLYTVERINNRPMGHIPHLRNSSYVWQ